LDWDNELSIGARAELRYGDWEEACGPGLADDCPHDLHCYVQFCNVDSESGKTDE
jgi:hypothetical protein